MDNVLGRPLFKFNQGGIGRMMQQLIAAGYDVSKLDESRIISLYDYVYGSGEGKDYVPAVSTYKAQGGPVKLAEGESVPRYQTGPSSLGKLFSRFMNPPNENVINSIRKQAKSYYFNALLPSKDGTGSYTMKQMEAAEKKANELAEMDVMAYLENFKSVDPMKKAKSENPILNYRDTYSEDDEGGFPTDVIVDEMKFHRAILNSPEFEDKMIDMDALNKKMFSLDAPTYQYLLNLPKKEQDKFVKKYVARNAQYDIERADDTASDYMKRRYGMAQGGMPNTTENVGIMDGVGIGAEALMAQEQAIDQAQDIGGLMSAIRGKPVNEEEARSELAELVGPEDAQATPDSVLALVQPVMELSKGQGIAQFVEEAEMPETQTMAQGGPVKLAEDGFVGDAMINQYRGYDIPDLRTAYESQYPVIQDIVGGPADTSGLKSDILFQIAAGGLEMARARKPGEPSDFTSIFAQSFQQPLLNIGALARDFRKTQSQEEKQVKGTALNLAQGVISDKKSEIDQIIATDLEKQKQEKADKEREEDLLGDTQIFYSVMDKKNIPISKKAVIDLRKAVGEDIFNQNFLPEVDFESGQYQVINREGGKPGLFPTGYATLSFNKNDGLYYYVNDDGSLTSLPPDITVTSKVSATATAANPSQKVDTGFLDAYQATNQISGGIMGLDDLYSSLDDPGAQAGPIGNIKKIAQNLMSIAEDAGLNFDPIYESMLEYTNQKSDRLDPFINQARNQFEADIGYILQKRAEQGVESLSDDETKLLEDQNVMKKFLDGKAFVGRDEKGDLKIMPLEESYIDEALFQNAIKVNALIYAVARARKPTGRLNVDDIKNASNDINIWSMGEKSLKASLRAIREELVNAGTDKIKEMIISGSDSAIYEPYMENFFVTPSSFNKWKQQYQDAKTAAQNSGQTYVDVTVLPEIQDRSSFLQGGSDDFLVPGGSNLPATGESQDPSMNDFINKMSGGN